MVGPGCDSGCGLSGSAGRGGEDALLTLTAVAVLVTALRAKGRLSTTHIGVIGALCLAIVGLLFV